MSSDNHLYQIDFFGKRMYPEHLLALIGISHDEGLTKKFTEPEYHNEYTVEFSQWKCNEIERMPATAGTLFYAKDYGISTCHDHD